MKTIYKQFARNMLAGIVYSAVWYFGFFIWIKGFSIPTILTNIIGFFVGRYWIFRETSGVKENVK